MTFEQMRQYAQSVSADDPQVELATASVVVCLDAMRRVLESLELRVRELEDRQWSSRT